MIAARASLLALLVCWAFAAAADVAVPPLSGRVVDQTGTLSASDISSLTQTLRDLETRKGSQVAVLIVPTTAPETIEQYSIRVAEAWKIGRKKIDDGALLVVAKNDRKLRIEVGYGLEGSLTDATASRIIDEIIVPKFRSGDFAGGIAAGVGRIVAVIDGEKLPPPAAPRQNSDLFSHIDSINPFALFALIIVGGILRSVLGRLIGSAATGGVVAVLAWFIAGSLAASVILGAVAFLLTMFGETIASSGGRGGWSGGGGSFSGSSSGDSGGFSGGGGSFGGGGASGSW
ncbi:MAG TPA: YgcG family protein [Steroidobacteraceae bacterium]|nr:YgcG family protein [Steroidobacteraceae bacterium]